MTGSPLCVSFLMRRVVNEYFTHLLCLVSGFWLGIQSQTGAHMNVRLNIHPKLSQKLYPLLSVSPCRKEERGAGALRAGRIYTWLLPPPLLAAPSAPLVERCLRLLSEKLGFSGQDSLAVRWLDSSSQTKRFLLSDDFTVMYLFSLSGVIEWMKSCLFFKIIIFSFFKQHNSFVIHSVWNTNTKKVHVASYPPSRKVMFRVEFSLHSLHRVQSHKYTSPSLYHFSVNLTLNLCLHPVLWCWTFPTIPFCSCVYCTHCTAEEEEEQCLPGNGSFGTWMDEAAGRGRFARYPR